MHSLYHVPLFCFSASYIHIIYFLTCWKINKNTHTHKKHDIICIGMFMCVSKSIKQHITISIKDAGVKRDEYRHSSTSLICPH